MMEWSRVEWDVIKRRKGTDERKKKGRLKESVYVEKWNEKKTRVQQGGRKERGKGRKRGREGNEWIG